VAAFEFSSVQLGISVSEKGPAILSCQHWRISATSIGMQIVGTTPLSNNPGFLPSQLDAGKSNTFNQWEARVQMEDSENTDFDWSQSVKNLFEKG
jgi:hypothetical protein